MYRYLGAMVLMAGCTVDYGPPSADTEISVRTAGGNASNLEPDGFHLVGTTVTYMGTDGATESAELSTDVVAQMIGELEHVEFLDIDLSSCHVIVADSASTRISATVAAGSNQIDYNSDACDRKDIDQLLAQLDSLSGFAEWEPP